MCCDEALRAELTPKNIPVDEEDARACMHAYNREHLLYSLKKKGKYITYLILCITYMDSVLAPIPEW